MPQSPDHSDAELVSQTARVFLDRYGAKATAELEYFAEIAAGIGDRFSADAWLEIADAAAGLLMQQGAGGSLFLHPARTVGGTLADGAGCGRTMACREGTNPCPQNAR